MADVYRNEILLPRCSIGFEEPETKKLAERVDRVLSTLAEQLKAFEAAGSLTVGGIPAASVVAGSNAMYYQTFESNVHNAWNLRSGSTSGITYPNNGQAGGRALRTTNKAVWIASNVNLPLDPARLYRMRTRVRKISGTNRQVAVGVEGIGADGVTVVDRSGGTGTTTTQNLVALNATISSTTWTTYEGYFKGVAATGTATSPSTDASLPRVLHSSTKYIRPFLALSIGGDDGVYEIDYLTLEILTETSEVNKILTEVAGRAAGTIAGTIGSTGVITENNVDSGSIDTGAVGGGGDGGKNHVAAGSIQASNIKALTITANEIAADTITAAKIAANTITAAEIAAMTITASEIAANTITAAKIAAGTITATEIAALTITAAEIAAATITGAKLVAGTITATQLTGTTLSALYADLGTITAGKIEAGSISIDADTERILMGAATAPLTGTGVFLGKDGTDYEFRIGDPATANKFIHWDGTNFTFPSQILNPPTLLWAECSVDDTGAGLNENYSVTWGRGATVSDTTHYCRVKFYKNGVLMHTISSLTPSDDADTWSDVGEGDGVADNHHAVVELYNVTGGATVSIAVAPTMLSTI